MYCYEQIKLILLYNIQAQSKLQISLIKPRVSRLNYEYVRANLILQVLIKRWTRRHSFNERWQNEISLGNHGGDLHKPSSGYSVSIIIVELNLWKLEEAWCRNWNERVGFVRILSE